MKNKFELLYNPFTRIAGWKAFVIGFAVVCLTVVLGSYSSVWFPGVLDAKMSSHIKLTDAFIVQFVGLGILVITFYLSSLIFARGTRFQDILGTTVLARFPYLFIVLLGFCINKDVLINLESSLRQGNFDELVILLPAAFSLLVVALLMIPLIVWFIALLYNAYRISTGLKGTACVLSFIGALLIAEIASLVAIFFVLRLLS